MMRESHFSIIDSESGNTVKLSSQTLYLSGQLLPMGCRLFVRHSFVSLENANKDLSYYFILPRESNLRSFEIRGLNLSVQSELEERDVELSQDNGSSFKNDVVIPIGKVEPGTAVTVYLELLSSIEIFDDGMHFTFPLRISPNQKPKALMVIDKAGLPLNLAQEKFAGLDFPVFEQIEGRHAIGFELDVAIPVEVSEARSSTHAIFHQVENGHSKLCLTDETEIADKDLVLDIKWDRATIKYVSSECAGILIPSTYFGTLPKKQKRVAFVLDSNSSMTLKNLEQGKKAIQVCLSALCQEDLFDIVSISENGFSHFKDSLVPGSMDVRQEAMAHLDAINTSDGKLVGAIESAMKQIGESGDVFVITNRNVEDNVKIIRNSRQKDIRVFVLGIGNIKNDRMLYKLCRETNGISRFVRKEERLDISAVDIFAAIGQTMTKDISVEFDGLSELTMARTNLIVFENSPLMLLAGFKGLSNPTMQITWAQGDQVDEKVLELGEQSDELSETLSLLYGTHRLADLEIEIDSASIAAQKPSTLRLLGYLRREQLQLSKLYGLPSKSYALAIKEDDQLNFVKQGMPDNQPADLSIAGTSHGGQTKRQIRLTESGTFIIPDMEQKVKKPVSQSPDQDKQAHAGLIKSFLKLFEKDAPKIEVEEVSDVPNRDTSVEEKLIYLASCINANGCINVKDDSGLTLSILALLSFVQNGHSETMGTFRLHVMRIMDCLEMSDDTSMNSIVNDLNALAESETDYLDLCLDLMDKKVSHERCKDIIKQDQTKL